MNPFRIVEAASRRSPSKVEAASRRFPPLCQSLTGLTLALTLIAGCAVGPDYQRPAALATNSIPAQFETASGVSWRTVDPAAHLPKAAWWEAFHDPTLSELEAQAVVDNQSLRIAAARLEAARADVQIAQSDFFPHLSATPAATRQRASKNIPENGHPAGKPYTFSNYLIPLQAGWEPDLWGRIRRQVEGAKARFQADADDLENARLAVQAEVAIDYFTLRSLDLETALLQATVIDFQRAAELVKNRRKGGIATDLDVAQAVTQLRATEAQVPAVEQKAARIRHALATLTGRPANGFHWEARTNFAFTLPVLSPGQPSELLERRLDVAASERRMAAANADIGLARTAFYPRFRINGLVGLQSVNAGTVFDASSRLWSVGPSVDWPLFTGGRNRAAVAAAEATYTATVAKYRANVLAAFQEVEDYLTDHQLLASELESESAARDAARQTEEIATHRYEAGLVTYLEVATAQSVALGHERTVVRLQGEQAVALASLAKALGGGWSPADRP